MAGAPGPPLTVLLASTALRVLVWYYLVKVRLDAPVSCSIDTTHALAEWVPAARDRENQLLEVCTIGTALARLPAPERALLAYRYGPPRPATDRELSDALDVDLLIARALVLAALLAFGGQLARMGLVDINGRPKWRGLNAPQASP